MKFSNKSKYGIAALIDLTVNTRKGHVNLASIAQRNDISQQYLEQIFAQLKKAKLIKSIKGPRGGYVLGRPAEEISVSEIVDVLEGGYNLEEITLGENGQQVLMQSILQEDIVDKVNSLLEEYLSKLTLADLVKHYNKIQNEVSDMYYI